MTAVLPIEARDLSFRPSGHTVLDQLNATLRSPGITAIVGANGAGKSVTLRMLDGLLKPDAGSIRFAGRDVSTIRRAFVFHKPALVRGSVTYNVALALTALCLSRNVLRARVAEALDRVGLADRAHDAARKLSAGEQQRLALARVWATEPQLLLLDEPTANLDPGATEAVESLIAAIAHHGAKVILVSHNLGQVARLAEDVLVLDRGRAVEHGPAQAILHSPQTPEARAYLKGELPWNSFAAAC